MVCLTSCVFRSIRFSGFARPHVGVRREGELYTRLQGEGKGGGMSPRDAHKSGDIKCLGALSRPRKGAGATGADPGRFRRRPASPARGAPPAAPRPPGLARAVSPRRHSKARAPRQPWDAGPKGGCRFLSALLRGGLAAGDVGLDARHDAHGERRCGIPRPSRARAFLRRPSPQKC